MSNADCLVVWANADNSVSISRRLSSGLAIPVMYPTQNLALVSKNVTGATFSVTVARPLAVTAPNEIALMPGSQPYICAFGDDKPSVNDPASAFSAHT